MHLKQQKIPVDPKQAPPGTPLVHIYLYAPETYPMGADRVPVLCKGRAREHLALQDPEKFYPVEYVAVVGQRKATCKFCINFLLHSIAIVESFHHIDLDLIAQAKQKEILKALEALVPAPNL